LVSAPLKLHHREREHLNHEAALIAATNLYDDSCSLGQITGDDAAERRIRQVVRRVTIIRTM
jgi:hypothetical protein